MKKSKLNIPNLSLLHYTELMLEIALASQSPRRRDLLLQAGLKFRVFHVKVSEIIDENLTAEEMVSQLATRKARACMNEHKELKSQGFLVLGADTLVVLNGEALGKPQNNSQAAEYLRRLSSKTHRVMTGMTLLESGTDRLWSGVEVTEVTFRALTESEIQQYVASGEPMDKAGAYAIQGEGGKFVSTLRGSWSNVVGLPLERLEKALDENAWTVGRHTSTHP